MSLRPRGFQVSISEQVLSDIFAREFGMPEGSLQIHRVYDNGEWRSFKIVCTTTDEQFPELVIGTGIYQAALHMEAKPQEDGSYRERILYITPPAPQASQE